MKTLHFSHGISGHSICSGEKRVHGVEVISSPPQNGHQAVDHMIIDLSI